MPLKQKILEYLAEKDYVHKGELGRMAVLEWGYENENLGRRCRELENDGLIVKKLNDKREVMYKITPEPQNCVLSPVTEQKGINTQVALFEVKLKPKSPYDY